jgi:hypothetical protein
MKPVTQQANHLHVAPFAPAIAPLCRGLPRRSPRDSAGVWRGWIEKVPDPRALDQGEASVTRMGFLALTEVPDLMLRMMQTATPLATSDRRPNR